MFCCWFGWVIIVVVCLLMIVVMIDFFVLDYLYMVYVLCLVECVVYIM